MGDWKLQTIERSSVLMALSVLTKKNHELLTALNSGGTIPKKKASESRNLHEEINHHLDLHRAARAKKRAALEAQISAAGMSAS